MKIGIITLVGNNYGNRLQNYAVQELLSKYGDVYTVKHEKKVKVSGKKNGLQRYMPSHIIEALDSRLINKYHISNRQMNLVSRILYFLKHKDEINNSLKKRDEAFLNFDNNYIHYEKEFLHLSGDDDERWVKSYGAWVCGSDQIWNPTYPTATRNAFLQFASEQRRISLSASIGISDVNEMLPEYPEWLKSIPYLSVREERAAEIIAELADKKAEVFLDPTMLIPLKKWNDIAESAETFLPEKFALCYFLGIREKRYVEYIKEHTNNMELVDLLNGEYTQYLEYGPAQVLDAIKNAEIVFVDSFHGAVFSILFHKQFVVFERSEKGKNMNSRLQTLLKRFNLENRIFNENNLEELETEIDYSKVDMILMEERVRVEEFLNKAMNEISKLPSEESNSIKHIEITRPEKCCGCTACFSVCPKKCIKMIHDKEGFNYPEIDEKLCINCGQCVHVCPVINHEGGHSPIRVLAEKNKDEHVRAASSSGGVFTELAKKFILNGGVVYGCALDDNMVAKHVCVTTLDELPSLRSSKYVQSDIGNVLFEIKSRLQSGEKVMFSGTPCQVAGLKKYLRKEYDNLLVVDVLCHGVPSPSLFADYLDYLSNLYGGAKPISVNFRSKKRGWKRLYMEIKFDNGKRHYVYSGYDRYESLFLNNTSLRPVCYECKFAKKQRYGDITLGDFWGIGKKYPKWDDDKGISVVMLNTEKGKTAYEKISSLFDSKNEDINTAMSGQRTLYAPTPKNPNRDEFYKMYIEKGCKEALEHFTSVPSLFVQIYYAIMRQGLDVVRKIMKKGY